MWVKLSDEERYFKSGVTLRQVLRSFPTDYYKGAVCAKINDRLIDLEKVIRKSCTIEIITKKSPEYKVVLRHSASHILAQAVKTMFPTVKCWHGYMNKIGFYCDFDFKTPVTYDDLSVIEDEMNKIIKANFEITRKVVSKDEAIEIMKDAKEQYKLELIKSFSDRKKIILYSQGDYIELCSGPHIKSTDQVKYFKLTKISGSRLRDNVYGKDKKMLTRIYGVVFEKKNELDEFLKDFEAKNKKKIAKLRNN